MYAVELSLTGFLSSPSFPCQKQVIYAGIDRSYSPLVCSLYLILWMILPFSQALGLKICMNTLFYSDRHEVCIVPDRVEPCRCHWTRQCSGHGYRTIPHPFLKLKPLSAFTFSRVPCCFPGSDFILILHVWDILPIVGEFIHFLLALYFIGQSDPEA